MDDRRTELEHRYGPRVHVLADPFVCGLLGRIGSPEVKPPLLLDLVRTFYATMLARVVASEFPATEQAIHTRMREHTERGVWRGKAVARDTRVAIANVMRAGNLPSLTCFERLTALLDPDGIRIDHFYFARRTDANGQVIGVDSAGSKVGGGIDGAVLLIPDPMGATGSTTIETLRAYSKLRAGRPSSVIAMHLIVTPEYIRRVLEEAPEVVIYAGRVDRGMSDASVLATMPGTHLERESGLNEVQYIVPGAGGLGEVLTNAFV